MKKKALLSLVTLVCALACVFGFAACDENVAVDVSSVTLDETTLELTVGEEATLKATVSPDNATDKTVTWSSDNSESATVDNGGKVAAIASGTAVITAKTANGKSATCTVTVKEATVSIAGTYYTYWNTGTYWKYGDGEDIVMEDDGTCALDTHNATYNVDNDGAYCITTPMSAEYTQTIYAKINGKIMWLFQSKSDAVDIENAIGFAYNGNEIASKDKTEIETLSGVGFPTAISLAEKIFVFSDETKFSEETVENGEYNETELKAMYEGTTLSFTEDGKVTFEVKNDSIVLSGSYNHKNGVGTLTFLKQVYREETIDLTDSPIVCSLVYLNEKLIMTWNSDTFVWVLD